MSLIIMKAALKRPIDRCHIWWLRLTLKDATFFWRISAPICSYRLTGPTAIKFGTLTHVGWDMLSGVSQSPSQAVGTQALPIFLAIPCLRPHRLNCNGQIWHSNSPVENVCFYSRSCTRVWRGPVIGAPKFLGSLNICRHGVTLCNKILKATTQARVSFYRVHHATILIGGAGSWRSKFFWPHYVWSYRLTSMNAVADTLSLWGS